jgi:hypothetical protein
MNLCRTCDQDFGSVELFDRHRVGTHSYTYSEGARMDPPRDDGRRCLGIVEMREKGWALDKRGRWFDPARATVAARMRGSGAETRSGGAA